MHVLLTHAHSLSYLPIFFLTQSSNPHSIASMPPSLNPCQCNPTQRYTHTCMCTHTLSRCCGLATPIFMLYQGFKHVINLFLIIYCDNGEHIRCRMSYINHVYSPGQAGFFKDYWLHLLQCIYDAICLEQFIHKWCNRQMIVTFYCRS